ALAYSIRSEVALMMSLPLLLLLLSKAIHQKSRSSFLFPASGLLSLLVVLVLIDLAAYSGTTWSAYRTYNASRESIVDYDGYPAFDTHEDAYRTLGITESSYVAASSYYALAQDPHWTAESMQTLAEISAKEHSLEHVSGQVIYLRLTGQLIRISSEILRDWFETDNRPCNLISLVLFVLFALLTIGQLCKCRWEALIAFLAVLVSHYALMGYLYYIGRHPYRVTQCIYIAEIFWLLFLLLRYEVSRFPLFLSALVLILTVRFAPHKLLDTARTSASILTYSENYEALRAYTDAHPDTLYLTDTLSVTYFTKNALQAASYEANVLPLGTWCAGSPWYSAVFSSFGITDASQLLLDDPQSAFLIMDLGQEDPASYLTAYYEEYLGKEVNATVADTIDCSEDIRFYVITLSSAQPAGK
ncbi:MAG: hypothetical protein K6G23_03810, partial [Lachnospiraceae bacterium]|nr:hypothetical protein [Lachnospiraceae bacterium]